MTNRIIELARKHIPNKNIKVRKSDPPWLNKIIKKLMRKRKRLFDKYKRTNNLNDFERYKQVRNRVTGEIRKSKKIQLDKLSDKLKNSSTGPKDWWRTLKGFIKPSKTSSVSPLNVDGKIYSDDKEKVNLLNNFLQNRQYLTTVLRFYPSLFPGLIPNLKLSR